MIANLVMIEVKPQFIDDFAEISVYNHTNSVKEDGCVRFDVLHNADEPCKFTLYEVWRDKESLSAHKETVHYKKWANTISEMMASPRYKISNTTVAYTE